MGKTESIKERRVDVYLDTLGRKERWTELAEEADESLSNSLLFRRYVPDHDYELLGRLR